MKILLHEITYNFFGEFVSQLLSLLFVGIKITSFHENSSFFRHVKKEDILTELTDFSFEFSLNKALLIAYHRFSDKYNSCCNKTDQPFLFLSLLFNFFAIYYRLTFEKSPFFERMLSVFLSVLSPLPLRICQKNYLSNCSNDVRNLFISLRGTMIWLEKGFSYLRSVVCDLFWIF